MGYRECPRDNIINIITYRGPENVKLVSLRIIDSHSSGVINPPFELAWYDNVLVPEAVMEEVLPVQTGILEEADGRGDRGLTPGAWGILSAWRIIPDSGLISD
jgi:hypothetical protein